jgi:exodeoxyribonuclease VII large subunit
MTYSDEEAQYEARGHRQDSPLSISQLTWFIKNTLERAVPRVWVEGEVSDLSQPSSGHCYFSLRDDQTQIRGVIWRSTNERLPFELKDGMSIVCCGAIEVYPPRGTYQLVINRLQPQGIGPLQLAFQQMHQKLSAQGLFDAKHKRTLPTFPQRIGFVTSPSGAAVHDFLEASKDLWNDFQLTLIPARVQGEAAATDIVRGIRQAQKISPTLDVLIVGRGGGSMEDLWCFNEEAVVRAVRSSRIPTVSAVGHEIDITLSDLAADARALTPTHAAQLVLPNQAEISSRLVQLRRRMDATVRSRVLSLRQQLERLSQRSVLARPHELHLHKRQLVDEWELRGRNAIWNLLQNRKERLAGMARAAEALSPLSVLSRGYSLTKLTSKEAPLQSVDQVRPGDELETTLSNGRIISVVERTAADG